MNKYTNNLNIDMAVAAWLASDQYTHNPDPYTISATSLLKPVRELALQFLPGVKRTTEDVMDLRASRVGTSVHDSIRVFWEDPVRRRKALLDLGMPESFCDRIDINPLNINDDRHSIYLEQRGERKLGKWTITGEFDFWEMGCFHDFKNTGTYTYQKGTKDLDYVLQMSIYRWIFQDMLYSDGLGKIHFLFSNWTPGQISIPNYPPTPIITQEYALYEPAKTERWLKDRLAALDQAIAVMPDQTLLPVCTNKERWLDPAEYKYFAKPDAKRATKNFGTDAKAAYDHRATKGTGVVKEFKQPAKYCANYCSARQVCELAKS